MQYPNLQKLNGFSKQEVFFDEYKPHLDELLKIVKAQGEPLEGNIFYTHHMQNPGDVLVKNYLPKRLSLAAFAMAHNNIMEIGFNAGFSALLMLTANPNLHLVYVDICEHSYTLPCYDYLYSVFGNRIQLVQGDSTKVLVNALTIYPQITGYIIDGGHSLPVAEQDLQNVLQYANKNAVLCFDDSDFPELRLMLDIYMMAGHLTPIWDPYAIVQNETQMFFKISCNNLEK